MFIILLESVRRRDYWQRFFKTQLLQTVYIHISIHFWSISKSNQKSLTYIQDSRFSLPEYFSLVSPNFLFSLLSCQLEFIRKKSIHHTKRKAIENGVSVYSCRRTALVPGRFRKRISCLCPFPERRRSILQRVFQRDRKE